ncbi:MAG: hypothetical protein HFE39_08905 [Clostridiales bacterium]|jgi:endo-beta-N-acetylglucosaminidase D|nr:hypothetical protein [Clostridiales bacterium]
MKKRFRRSMSVVLAVTMATSCLATGLTAMAADSWPPRGDSMERAKAQPHFSGYRMKDVRNWDGETDPFAEMMRARVPMQERNDPFKPTQANPTLESDAKIMLMQGDYGNSFVDSMMYNNDFSEHCLNFWQYADYFCPWHGAATAYTPSALYNPVTSDWRARGFEFGMLNIPNPAYTNAAHKNGVMSIGCLYFDQAFRAGQSINELLEMDDEGNFLLVDKLVAIADYYGFDGYFLNREDSPYSDTVLREFMKQLTAKGMWTQFYDVGSSFNSSKAQWVQEGIYDSIFFNYGGWGTAKNAYEWSNQNGMDVYDWTFFGVECNQGQFTRNVITSGYMPGTKNLYASVALFTPSDFYQRGVDFGPSTQKPSFQQAEYQWMVTERERMFFSGVTQDPTDTGLHSGFARPDLGVNSANGWVGAADFTAERSVVDGSVFYTNFNTGHGMQYFDNGSVGNDDQWANINIQDILPTWQWWMETEGTKLKVDFDYGPKEIRFDKNGNQMTLPYTQIGAYKGGSSLAVYGKMDAENFLRLYKTDLSVNENSKISITYNKTSADDASSMEVGIIFKNSPDSVYTINVPNSGKQTDGWVTKNLQIDPEYAGEEIAAIGVNFKNNRQTIDGYQMNVGEIRVTDGQNHTPDAPSGLAIREAYDSKEMVLTWDLGDYNEIDQYNVYANLSDGSRVCLGGIYDEIYYVKNTLGTDIITVDVVAVGKDGTESEPASVEFAYNQNVSDIVVNETLDGNKLFTYAADAGYLDISWQNPNVEYASLKLDLSLVNSKDDTTYSMSVGNDADSARFYIPRGHGETYDLKITTVFADGSESEPIAYRGKLKDVWSQPIDAVDVKISGNKVSFVNPASVDWYKIHGYVNGQEVIDYKRGASSINGSKTLPGSSGILEIVLEDYSGNMSDPVYFAYGGDSGSASGPINETNIPDAVLRQAIQEQIGSTISALAEFTGTLDLTGLDIHDLTGLNLVAKAENIILSGTPIESIGSNTFGANVQKVDLSNCTNLTIVDKGAFKGTMDLREVDITGCTGLKVLEIVDSSVEILTYGDAEAFPEMIRLNLSGSRFDLSEGTPERDFVNQIATQVDEEQSIETVDPNEVNLALNAKIVANQTNINNAYRLFDGLFNYFTAGVPLNIVADLGAPQTITSWKLFNDTYTNYGLADFNIYGSNDAENYELIASVTGNTSVEVSQVVANPQPYRYYKLEGTKHMGSGADLRELELYGHNTIVYESEVIYNNQRPRILPAEMNTTIITQKKNGLVLDLNEMLQNAIDQANATSVTIRGNEAGSLAGADFIDPNYTLAAEAAGKVKDIHAILVTDAAGNVTRTDRIDGSIDGVYTVEYITYDSANLEGEAAYTFTVKVRAITSVLEEVIAKAEQLIEEDALNNTMEAVVTEYYAALNAAKEMVAQEYASQAEINAATVRLLAVMAKVDWKQGDKTILAVAIEVAEAIEPNLDKYVDDCIAPFTTALAEARKIYASGNAWDDDIQAATKALIDAMNNMKMKADKEALKDLINKANGVNYSAYTAESADAVRAALDAAQAIANDGNATQQAVDAAANTLKTALAGLTVKNADTNTPADGNNGVTTPVGDGSAPTQTGDGFNAAGLMTLALVSAAGVALMMRKRRDR